MESKGPYRIYDPGGSEPNPSINKGAQFLMKDNPALRESMEGIRSLGGLLEEAENEVLRLRKKAEALVKDNKNLQPSASLDSQPSFLEETVLPRELGAGSEQTEGLESSKMTDLGSDVHTKGNQKTPPSGSSSEFEILNAYETRKTPESRKLDPGPTLPQEDDTVQLHLQRMETSLNMFAEEPDQNRLLVHISRLALDFSRLANKVHRNEQKTSVLQTLCEQLRKENEELRSKLEADWNQRTQAEQAHRYENLELKKLILQSDRGGGTGFHPGGGVETRAPEDAAKLENSGIQQVAKLTEKPAVKDVSLLKKVKILEHQRTELLEVNKQWDQQFRSMKMQYEEKITSLRQKLSQAVKAESEQEVQRDQKQRDFDRKLLLARDKIEEKELQ
uniref:Tnip1 protein n=1 Tax=Xenopus laevis TaxID=8355 RepID=Q0IHD8_XENLA|nr:Tnip1 protein [Xenopus laevis]